MPIYLFVDNISEHQDEIERLFNSASRRKATVRVIGAESYNVWNTTCDALDPLVSTVHEMRYLSEKAMEDLLGKL